jgi:(p)ppGpp synthase/HD superfamily hydrolase
VPLDFGLKNGDIVEVLVNKSSARPSLDWLTIVKTSGAKHKIKQWFRKERKEENTLLGQEMLEAELVHQNVRLDAARGEPIEKIATKLNYTSASDLYAAIGFGDANAVSVAKRIKEDLKVDNVVDIQTLPRPATTRRVARNSSGIRIAGVDDVLVRLSKCCSPVPGDPIMGFVTIGRGVSVHRADCPNVAYMNAAPERILEASWADVTHIQHAVDIEIEAGDRAGLLQDVLGVCAELKTPVSSVNARIKRETASISITAQITNIDHLQKLLAKLTGLKGARGGERGDVERGEAGRPDETRLHDAARFVELDPHDRDAIGVHGLRAGRWRGCDVGERLRRGIGDGARRRLRVAETRGGEDRRLRGVAVAQRGLGDGRLAHDARVDRRRRVGCVGAGDRAFEARVG